MTDEEAPIDIDPFDITVDGRMADSGGASARAIRFNAYRTVYERYKLAGGPMNEGEIIYQAQKFVYDCERIKAALDVSENRKSTSLALRLVGLVDRMIPG